MRTIECETKFVCNKPGDKQQTNLIPEEAQPAAASNCGVMFRDFAPTHSDSLPLALVSLESPSHFTEHRKVITHHFLDKSSYSLCYV